MLDIPPFFARPLRERTSEEAAEVKALTHVSYKKPPVTLDELMHARLHSVFVVDVDSVTTQEVDPETCLETATAFIGYGHPDQGLYRNPRPLRRGFIFGEAAA